MQLGPSRSLFLVIKVRSSVGMETQRVATVVGQEVGCVVSPAKERATEI